jgi:hypothetical protein
MVPWRVASAGENSMSEPPAVLILYLLASL